MNQTSEVTMEVPMALQQLIRANNELLKKYQATLVQQIEVANEQMMQLLRLNPAAGWSLDMERMKYVRQGVLSNDEQPSLNSGGEDC